MTVDVLSDVPKASVALDETVCGCDPVKSAGAL